MSESLESVRLSNTKEMSRVWSVFAILLIVATTISRNLTDLLFTLLALGLLYYEGRFRHWQGFKETFSRLKIANYLIGVWLFANIVGYFFSTEIGSLQLNEIFSLRWILCFYICVYLGMNLRFNEKVFRGVAGGYTVALLVGIFIQYFIYKKTDRLEGVFENPNVAAFSMAVPWGFLIAWESVCYVRTKRTDWYLVILSSLITVMLFFTYGRGIWFAMAFLLY